MKITYNVNGKRVFGNGRKVTDALVLSGVVMGHTTGGRPFIIGHQHFARTGIVDAQALKAV
jgi:hypothetical protein